VSVPVANAQLVQPLRELVQYVGNVVLPTALSLRFGRHTPRGGPKPYRDVSNRQCGGRYTASFEVSERTGPRLHGLPMTILDGNRLFPTVRQHADSHWTGQAIFLIPGVYDL